MIEWSEEREPNDECRVNHTVGQTSMGPIVIEWKGWKKQPAFGAQTPWGYEALPGALDLAAAKAQTQAIWDDKIEQEGAWCTKRAGWLDETGRWECSRCHKAPDMPDGYEVPGHGMCWECASEVLDEIINLIPGHQL